MTLAEAFAADPWLLIGSVFLIGLVIGSFLNVVIYRLPVMLDRQWKAHAAELLNPEAVSADQSAVAREAPFNLMTPPSRCPACGTRIKPQHNVPVLSYVFLGGKCAACKARISVRYPVVEFATAVLSAAVAWRFGWQWQMLGGLLLTWSLVALTLIDFDHQILPDIITLPLLWLGLLASLGYAAGMTPPLPVDMRSAIIGAAAGYLSLWSIYWAFKLLTGKEGMGYGDFKLFGALGAWMGWQMLPLIILLSAFTGAAVGIVLIIARGRDRNIPIPFGPYLAAAGWIAMMWGPQLVGGYLKAVGLQG